MRSIALLNQKGGVGKTTTAVNVAAALARTGKHVLLIDLDPQCHATLHVGLEPSEDELSGYDVMVHGRAVADVAQSVGDNLVVVPAHLDLVGAEIELATREERETVLTRALHPYHEGFDYCIIDCAPSLGLLTINALAAVNEVIIPLQPHFLGLQGLGRLLETVSAVREGINPGLRVSGVVLCMFEKGTRLAQEVRSDVTEFIAAAEESDPWFGARVFETTIRRNIKLAECPSFGQTIFEYAPTSHGADDYDALAEELHSHSPRPPASAKPAADVLPQDADRVAPEAPDTDVAPAKEPASSQATE